MRRTDRKTERGFSLIVSLLALMLLSAVAIGMMFMASTETAVSANFKAEENAYFAARAGVEEARDRMRADSTNPITLPTALPTNPPIAGSVLYITQTGVTLADITDASKKTFDDEICHDFPSYYGTTTLNVPCSASQGPNPAWITTTPSVAPYPLEYKWVRVTLKQNNSSPYPVAPSPAPGSYLACWNGIYEVATGTTCPAENLPVYLVTALAVTQSGARRLVQQEIALTQTSSTLPGGMFATSKQCPALILKGGAKTGSFDSATENPVVTPPSNCVLSGGDVGANGGVLIAGGSSTATTCTQNGGGGTAVNGNVSTGTGVCPGNGITENGTPTVHSTSQNPVYTPPTPPAPNPPPPTTKCPAPAVPAQKKPPTPAIPACTIPATLPPGSYGDYTISGTVNLVGGADINHPAIYTFNSLSEGSANALINVTGPVVINLAGAADANLKGNPPTVLNLDGNGFANSSGRPDYLVINYGGSDNISMNGNSTFYGVINAPNASIKFNGGMQCYGQVIGSTIDDEGGASFFWDTSVRTTVTTTQPYFSEIALRELSY